MKHATGARIELRKGKRRGSRNASPRSFWRFVVIADNGEVIATSEHYSSKSRAISGVEALVELIGSYDLPIVEGP